MARISYAQNHEDILLSRLWPDGSRGLYVDIGANHPVEGSVTRYFYERGWSGVNVEPQATMHRLLSQHRPRDVNLLAAVSAENGQATLYRSDNPALSGLATCRPDLARVYDRAGHRFAPGIVSTRTLACICAEHVDFPIAFMSIDVEGAEAQVIAGGDWARWRPAVVVVEAVAPVLLEPGADAEALSTSTHEEWEEILLEADYLFAAFDGVNRFYVRGEDAQLLSHFQTPVNVLDHFISHREVRLSQECLSLQAAIQAEIQGRCEQVARLDGEILALHEQLNTLEASTSLQLARRLHRLGDTVAPSGSRRGRWIRALTRRCLNKD